MSPDVVSVSRDVAEMSRRCREVSRGVTEVSHRCRRDVARCHRHVARCHICSHMHQRWEQIAHRFGLFSDFTVHQLHYVYIL